MEELLKLVTLAAPYVSDAKAFFNVAKTVVEDYVEGNAFTVSVRNDGDSATVWHFGGRDNA